MIALTFDQPNVVRRLCLALPLIAQRGESVSARNLAEFVVKAFPAVPLSVLRVHAAAVLRLHFEPLEIPDMHKAGLDNREVAEACQFIGDALAAEADALRASRPGPHLSVVQGDAA